MRQGSIMKSDYKAAVKVISNPKSTEVEISRRLLGITFSDEDAIRLSILHWEKNEWYPTLSGWSQGSNCNSCALCHKYNAHEQIGKMRCYSIVDRDDNFGYFTYHIECPLSKVGAGCNKGNSPWRSTLKGRKQRMINTLRKCLKMVTSKKQLSALG